MTYRRGLLLAVTATLLWSTTALVVRLIEDADVWAILFWRSVGLLPVLLAWIAWRHDGAVQPAFRRIGWSGILGAAALVVAYTGAIHSFQTTTVANAVFLYAATPIFAALLARVFLHEAVHTATWAAMAMALTGIFVMVRDGLGTGAMAGNLSAVLCALGFATFTVTLRWGKGSDRTPVVALSGVLAMIVAAGMSVGTGGTLLVSVPDGGLAVLAGAVILACGMILYTEGSRVLSAAEATLLTMVEVMLAPVWAFAVLGEAAGPATLIGGTLLLAGVTLNALAGAQRRASVGASGVADQGRPVNE